MDQNTAGGLLILGLIILVIYNFKAIVAFATKLVGIALFFGTCVFTLVAITKMDNGWQMLLVGIVGFGLAGKIADWFDLGSQNTTPPTGGGSPGPYPQPKKECPYCQGSRRIGCDRIHTQPTADNPCPICWKCGNTGYMSCPHCP